ncbi:MAG: DUF6883 domain-containing protein [Candidatus Binatia bacterium]
MKLPNRENAYIPPPKLITYLLSEAHSVGRAKAGFWRTLGFDEMNLNVLEQALVSLARSEEVKEVVLSPYGVKYVIEGVMQTPAGSIIQVRTVWIIETNQDRPRFVTAYPA